MLIWTLAGLLFLVLGAIGFFQGAIRSLISLAGVIAGVCLAGPLSPWVRSMLAMKNPLWNWILPPVIVFLVVSVLITGLGYFVQFRVALYYKYKTDDVQRLRWERLNRRVGASIGILMGAMYLVLISVAIYVLGYLTVQVSAEENDPLALRLLNKARYDLRETGLGRTVAAFDPASPWFYDAADVVGSIYQNPLLYSRISNYPPFISLLERTEFQDIATDTTLMGKLQSRASIAELLKDPKIQAIANNPEIMSELKQVDLKDLRQYLETGKSPKYFDEKILGRWQLDPEAMVTELRKIKPNITAGELLRVRKFAATLAGITFTATVDHKVQLKVNLPMPPAAKPPAPTEESAGASLMEKRYGPRVSPGGTPKPPVAAAPAPEAPAQMPLQFSGEGEWQGDGERYTVSVKDPKGPSATMKAQADDETLKLFAGNQTVVFLRAD